jgi:hypothetical protein
MLRPLSVRRQSVRAGGPGAIEGAKSITLPFKTTQNARSSTLIRQLAGADQFIEVAPALLIEVNKNFRPPKTAEAMISMFAHVVN